MSDDEQEDDNALSARSLSDSSSDVASDADDVFKLVDAEHDMLPREYQDLFLYRWQLATSELSNNHLREELTLPLDPHEDMENTIWDNVDEAVVMPSWHCGFRGCKMTSASNPCKTINGSNFNS